MRKNNNDFTVLRHHQERFCFLIKDYELVKSKKHPNFRFVKDFYKTHNLRNKTFLKYYNRIKESGKKEDLLPQKRGPKYKTRRPLPFIENKVIELRINGINKFEINNILKPKLKQFTPSPSGMYNIFKRHNLNILNPKMKQNRRRIIKEKAGELGHIDCHYLNKDIINGKKKQLYIISLIDDCTRFAWAELIPNIKSLTVMFATLKSLNILNDHYKIKFKEIMSDNGVEFGSRNFKNKEDHPFERLLQELEIKHRYTQLYKPQTNGKVERFWRTLEDDMLRETLYDSEEELREELLQYIYYYNHERPHQGINGETPYGLLQKVLPN
jgi:transposase InsO family protein